MTTTPTPRSVYPPDPWERAAAREAMRAYLTRRFALVALAAGITTVGCVMSTVYGSPRLLYACLAVPVGAVACLAAAMTHIVRAASDTDLEDMTSTNVAAAHHLDLCGCRRHGHPRCPLTATEQP